MPIAQASRLNQRRERWSSSSCSGVRQSHIWEDCPLDFGLSIKQVSPWLPSIAIIADTGSPWTIMMAMT